MDQIEMFEIPPNAGHKNVTLADAKAWLEQKRPKGARCPCCDQYAKVYRRRINSAMAMALILIDRFFRKKPDGWLHVERYFKNIPMIPPSLRGDFPKLRHWGLLEMQESLREDGSNRVGYYRITEKGKKFVRGEVTVPKHMLIYNQEVQGFGEEQTDIRTALGTKFNYEELMAG